MNSNKYTDEELYWMTGGNTDTLPDKNNAVSYQCVGAE